MAYTTLQLEFNNHIAHLILNRPTALNSMNRAFWQELPAAIREVEQADDLRVLVISSTGKHFSAGMDLEVFSQPDPRMFGGEPSRRAEFMRRLVLELQACFTALEDLRIPVLAAIQGGCIGGALDLVAACDSRYCTEDAFFTIKETELGITADLGSLQRLPKWISPGLVRELAYTARHLSATEAAACGLVNRVFTDQSALVAGVMELAAQIAKHSPLAVAGSKAMLNYARDHSVAESLHYMATWQAGMFQAADLMESIQAKQAKRATQYAALHQQTPIMTKSTD
ncbi:crotonase/enoyl-CoA hydratase family protein [Thiothrix eikelboomii]|uniref:crotonase/enoyl-CoA hydratase family protein n=1 Tax=Thiothrix eikelboomii TaxID=92487 RepID=UPI003BAE5A7D